MPLFRLLPSCEDSPARSGRWSGLALIARRHVELHVVFLLLLTIAKVFAQPQWLVSLHGMYGQDPADAGPTYTGKPPMLTSGKKSH